MVRGVATILGLGLVFFWIAGLSRFDGAGWVTWVAGVAAVASYILAGAAEDPSSQKVRRGGCFSIGVGLLAVWAVALATAVVPWMTWGMFAFACAFLLLGAAVKADRKLMENETSYRRSA